MPIHLGEVVERVTNCKFLGVTVAEDLSWGINTASTIGKAQQRLFYLRKVKSAKLLGGGTDQSARTALVNHEMI